MFNPLKNKTRGRRSNTPDDSSVRKAFKSPFRVSEEPSTNTILQSLEPKFGTKANIQVLCDDVNGASCSNFLTPTKNISSHGLSLKRKLPSTQKFKTPFKSPSMNNSSPLQSSFTSIRSNVDFLHPEDQLAYLLSREAELDQEIKELLDQGFQEEELQDHIDQLHRYNETKDAAQAVLGRLAEMEGVTIKEMHQKYGMSAHE